MDGFITLFDGQTANGESAPSILNYSDVILFVGGTFDGATVKLLVSPDVKLEEIDSEYYEDVNGTFTEKAYRIASLGVVKVKGEITNAGAGTEINMELRPRYAHVASL